MIAFFFTIYLNKDNGEMVAWETCGEFSNQVIIHSILRISVNTLSLKILTVSLYKEDENLCSKFPVVHKTNFSLTLMVRVLMKAKI